MANFTKTRDKRRQTMDHIVLGKSFQIVNLSEKNNNNVYLC